MSPDQQRVAIAEACGWKSIHAIGTYSRYEGYNPRTGVLEGLPWFLADLNAMHEAEKVLTTEQAWQYNRTLSELLGTAAGLGSGELKEWSWHATAAQRAEAFLKTLNLWTP